MISTSSILTKALVVCISILLIACNSNRSAEVIIAHHVSHQTTAELTHIEERRQIRAAIIQRKYGLNQNSVRSELNIPIVNSLYNFDPDELTWEYGDFDEDPSGYYSKKAFCHDTIIISETDSYLSGAFNEEEPHEEFEWGAEPLMKFYEQLEVTYYYDTSAYGGDSFIDSKQWLCTIGYFDETIGHYFKDRQISLDQSDSILNSWDVDRLNFTGIEEVICD